jgi:hypothetical protein
MLCDDIVSDLFLQDLYDGLPKVVQKIRYAQKFVLAKEFCLAADGLVENVPELDKVVPMCRIPHPLTWIEFLHDDRPHWDPQGPHGARPVDPTRHQGPPQRVGFLLEQMDDKAKKWNAHLFWKLRTAPVNVIDGTMNNGSLMCIHFDCDAPIIKEPFYDAIRPSVSDFGTNLLMDMVMHEPNVAKRLLEYGEEDWGGEARFLVAVLGLLNARNVVETQKIDHTEYNKKRVKQGKRELFSHTILKVRPFIVQHEVVREGGHRNIRMHFVRGHFKHRRTGLFWWSMHARGDAKFGKVEHDYVELEGK